MYGQRNEKKNDLTKSVVSVIFIMTQKYREQMCKAVKHKWTTYGENKRETEKEKKLNA